MYMSTNVHMYLLYIFTVLDVIHIYVPTVLKTYILGVSPHGRGQDFAAIGQLRAGIGQL